MNAETLLQEYSGMTRNQQRKFDKLYVNLLRFRRTLEHAAKNPAAFIKEHKTQKTAKARF